MFENRWLTAAHAALIREARTHRRELPPRWAQPSARNRRRPAGDRLA